MAKMSGFGALRSIASFGLLSDHEPIDPPPATKEDVVAVARELARLSPARKVAIQTLAKDGLDPLRIARLTGVSEFAVREHIKRAFPTLEMGPTGPE